MLSAFLQLDTLQHELAELAGVWDQFKIWAAFAHRSRREEKERRACYGCARKMSVTCLFFSPHKLIDSFQPFDPFAFAFTYQQDAYILLSNRLVTFASLPYPSSRMPPLLHYQLEAGTRLGAAKNETRGLASPSIADLLSLYKKNTFNTPIPAFEALFSEHATAPFFVFQVSCAALPCPDEYWYYSLFTLFILVMIKCTAVWRRVRTLTEFHSMPIEPRPMQS